MRVSKPAAFSDFIQWVDNETPPAYPFRAININLKTKDSYLGTLVITYIDIRGQTKILYITSPGNKSHIINISGQKVISMKNYNGTSDEDGNLLFSNFSANTIIFTLLI